MDRIGTLLTRIRARVTRRTLSLCANHTQVVLSSKVDGLGKEGELVTVQSVVAAGLPPVALCCRSRSRARGAVY